MFSFRALRSVVPVLSLATALAGLSGCAYSFGSDVREMGSEHSAVRLTSFGGDIDVPSAPRGVHVRSFGGSVRLGDIAGASDAQSFGGDVEVESLEGSARVSSFGGTVTVNIADDSSERVHLPRRVSIGSYGGEVVVRVPADFSARVDVRVRSHHQRADLSSDFRLVQTHSRCGFRRRWDQVRATGMIGGGRHLIVIKATDANVRLERVERS
jgi:DUF4097 and DUF4098 domain-containing protein YvlB